MTEYVNMDTTVTTSRADTLFPSRAKVLVVALVVSLLAGALYLIAARGDALMIDLAKIGQALCL